MVRHVCQTTLAFTTYFELSLIKDACASSSSSPTRRRCTRTEKAELLEEGFQAHKMQHADETALKVAELQAEIAKLQAAQYNEA